MERHRGKLAGILKQSLISQFRDTGTQTNQRGYQNATVILDFLRRQWLLRHEEKCMDEKWRTFW
jgi:hypothetical protein